MRIVKVSLPPPFHPFAQTNGMNICKAALGNLEEGVLRPRVIPVERAAVHQRRKLAQAVPQRRPNRRHACPAAQVEG